jgi:hypothetical protein
MNRRERRAKEARERAQRSYVPTFVHPGCEIETKHFHLPDGRVVPCEREDEHVHCAQCGKEYADSALYDGMACACGSVFTALPVANDDGNAH